MKPKNKRITINNQSMRIIGLEAPSIWRDFYFFVLVSPWYHIILLLSGLYLFINFTFACLYLLGGDCIEHARPGSLWDTFFFSVQTWATIGYGAMAPKTKYADILVGVESFSGLLSMSLVTGLLFSKFAQPKAKVRFTDKVLVTQFDGKPTLMFRMGNLRANQIVEARLMVVFTHETKTTEGVQFRKLEDLKLVRDSTVLLTLSWTALHIIDASSPLFNKSLDDLEKIKAQLVISLTGLDAQFNQTVHVRHQYNAQDFVWGHRFEDIIVVDESNERFVDYRNFDKLVELNVRN
jgi:inward rectifier potassium channel